MTQQNSGSYISIANINEELNVSRIFRRLYKESVQFIRKHEESLNNIFSNGSMNQKIRMMDTYCRMGMHIEAIVEANNIENKTLKIEIDKLNK